MKIPSSFKKLHDKLFEKRILRFIAIGGTGFVVNFIMLSILYHGLKLPIFVAQIISAEIALLTTFIGNNFWVFKDHHHIPLLHKLVKFHGTAGIGLVINSAFVIVLVKYSHFFYGAALVVGSLAGLVWNYTMNKHIIFKTKPEG